MKYLLLVILVVIACYYLNIINPLRFINKKEYLTHQIVKKVSRQLEATYHLSLVGCGGSEKKDLLTSIDLSFDRYLGPVSKEEGRKMIVDTVELFLKEINQNDDLKPFLYNFPFKQNNLKIIIINYYPDYSSVLHPDIEAFSSYYGKIFYDTIELNVPGNKSETSEDYETALAIVRSS